MDPSVTGTIARDTDFSDRTQEQQHAETVVAPIHMMAVCDVVRPIRKIAEIVASCDISTLSVAANQRQDHTSKSHGKQSAHSTSTWMNPVTLC